MLGIQLQYVSLLAEADGVSLTTILRTRKDCLQRSCGNHTTQSGRRQNLDLKYRDRRPTEVTEPMENQHPQPSPTSPCLGSAVNHHLLRLDTWILTTAHAPAHRQMTAHRGCVSQPCKLSLLVCLLQRQSLCLFKFPFYLLPYGDLIQCLRDMRRENFSSVKWSFMVCERYISFVSPFIYLCSTINRSRKLYFQIRKHRRKHSQRFSWKFVPVAQALFSSSVKIS